MSTSSTSYHIHLDRDKDDQPMHECGLFALYHHGDNAAHLAFFALYALQHRGQESAGIATCDTLSRMMHVHKGMGLVSHVFTEDHMKTLRGKLAIGHTRYSTAGGSKLSNAQPFVLETDVGPLAVAHNGQLTKQKQLRKLVLSRGVGLFTSSDSEIITQMLARPAMASQSESPPASPVMSAPLKDVPTPSSSTSSSMPTVTDLPFSVTLTESSAATAPPPKNANTAATPTGNRPLFIGDHAHAQRGSCARSPSPSRVQLTPTPASFQLSLAAPPLQLADNADPTRNAANASSASTTSAASSDSSSSSSSSTAQPNSSKPPQGARAAAPPGRAIQLPTSASAAKSHEMPAERRDQWEKRLSEFMSVAEGAYALVLCTPDAIYGVRDRYGLRPLCLGYLRHASGVCSYALASESCAFGPIGFTYLREVRAGEIVRLDERGVHSTDAIPTIMATVKPALCIFEYVYFARPDSFLESQLVHSVRQRLGVQLAKENPVDADLVSGVPDSSIAAAIGYSQQSGTPFQEVLCKNRYIGRTFIQPEQSMRDNSIRLKFNPLYENIRDRRVILVDDSIVRGSTMRSLIRLLKSSGAAEVHVRISSPVLKHPCYMGVDIGSYDEILATTLKTVEEMRVFLGADSLAFLSYQGLIDSVAHGADQSATRGRGQSRDLMPIINNKIDRSAAPKKMLTHSATSTSTSTSATGVRKAVQVEVETQQDSATPNISNGGSDDSTDTTGNTEQVDTDTGYCAACFTGVYPLPLDEW